MLLLESGEEAEENEEMPNDSNENEIALDSCPVTGWNSLGQSLSVSSISNIFCPTFFKFSMQR